MEAERSTAECIPKDDTTKLPLDPPPAYVPTDQSQFVIPGSSSQPVQYFSQEEAAVIPSQTQVDHERAVSLITCTLLIIGSTVCTA